MVLHQLQSAHGPQVRSQHTQQELGSVYQTESTSVKNGVFASVSFSQTQTHSSHLCFALYYYPFDPSGPSTCGAGPRDTSQKSHSTGAMHGLKLGLVRAR
jgi:hypothetical protein